MFKKIIYLFAVALALTTMSSCRHVFVPKAVNTINSVGLEEMNLERKDYIILNTVTAEATVKSRFGDKRIEIDDESGEFSIVFKQKTFGVGKNRQSHWKIYDVNGIAKLGFLNNDYDRSDTDIMIDPFWYSRNIAIYRIINASKVAGADGVIEPVISTNVEKIGKDFWFRTTVSAKLIKLKTDGK